MSRIGGAAPAAALTEPSIQCRWKLVALSTFWPLPHGPSPEPSPHNSAAKYYSPQCGRSFASRELLMRRSLLVLSASMMGILGACAGHSDEPAHMFA